MDVGTNVVGSEVGATTPLDFPLAFHILQRVEAEGSQLMNILAKAKSDKRVVEIKDAVDSGEAVDRAEAKVASGNAKPKEPPPSYIRNS